MLSGCSPSQACGLRTMGMRLWSSAHNWFGVGSPCSLFAPEEVRFAGDSPLEEAGFEPSVPH